MENSYAKWYDQEKAWIAEEEKKMKASLKKSLILVMIGCPIVLAIIGLAATGGELQAALQNFLIGIPVGIVLCLFTALMMKTSYPAKKYLKNIERELSQFPGTEKEEFARQMLGTDGPGSVKTTSFIMGESDKLEPNMDVKIAVTKEYAMTANGRGGISIVRLNQVANMDLEAQQHSVTVRSGDWKFRENFVTYPISFYYKTANDKKSKEPDKEFIFDDIHMRDTVVGMIQETAINSINIGKRE